jgi:hypothetical protein
MSRFLQFFHPLVDAAATTLSRGLAVLIADFVEKFTHGTDPLAASNQHSDKRLPKDDRSGFPG